MLSKERWYYRRSEKQKTDIREYIRQILVSFFGRHNIALKRYLHISASFRLCFKKFFARESKKARDDIGREGLNFGV